MRWLFGSLIAASAVASAALAQQAGTPPPPRILQGRDIPLTQPQQPLVPRRDDSSLRPIAPQSTLPVTRFNASGLECSADLSGGTLLIEATLSIDSNPAFGNQVSIDVLVDGVPAGAELLTFADGSVTVSRRVPVAGLDGEHQIVFVLDDVVRSEAQSASHACATLRPSVIEVGPGVLVLPNLAFGDLLYTQLSYAGAPSSPPPPPPSSGAASAAMAALLEQRVSLGNRRSFSDPIIVRELRTLAGRIQFPASPACPGEIDAYVSATFAVAVQTTRVADPSPYAQVIAGPFETPVDYIDTIDRPRWATGASIDEERYSGNPLPQGYQWIVFNAGLECTRDGVLEIRFDPGDTLSESREDDNVLRIRYATVPQ